MKSLLALATACYAMSCMRQGTYMGSPATQRVSPLGGN